MPAVIASCTFPVKHTDPPRLTVLSLGSIHHGLEQLAFGKPAPEWTLQVSIPVISTAAKKREEKMRNAKLPSWQIRVAATCNYISEEVHIRLRLISDIQLRRGCTIRIAWIQRRSLNQALAGYQTLVWQVKTCGVTCGLPVIIVGRVLPPKNCLIAKRFHHIWNDLQVRFRICAPCTLLLLAFPLLYPLSSELLHWYQWIIPVAKVCNSIMIYQN